MMSKASCSCCAASAKWKCKGGTGPSELKDVKLLARSDVTVSMLSTAPSSKAGASISMLSKASSSKAGADISMLSSTASSSKAGASVRCAGKISFAIFVNEFVHDVTAMKLLANEIAVPHATLPSKLCGPATPVLAVPAVAPKPTNQSSMRSIRSRWSAPWLLRSSCNHAGKAKMVLSTAGRAATRL